MPSTAGSGDKVAESLSNLALDPAKSISEASKAKSKKQLLDSWEDDDEQSDSEAENETSAPAQACTTGLSAPPPTPSSSKYGSIPGWSEATEAAVDIPRGVDGLKRPEKTDAVARRMIAAGLGLKAPKQTEEQKAYQRSIREHERKKREQQRTEEQRKRDEVDKAKAAVWDD
ncbi:uncharacterized protein UV8b_01509 [Ustilaginoidea virens]|uniref:Uncharacterized protein n=1 Tax=Ustilaginoidea virens TaxID=1159556 RepID=A0A063BZQ0_USTVR|nr:uncharacterized protein UV8b_01509 [Ustilaginoidea virens]QUC17268.1 hypothetical protein UV8b_01509 [Ustilaginoidea virens]GAO15654.1 hypothetical protein UVI_02019280 [Ustilaginoidea virens]